MSLTPDDSVDYATVPEVTRLTAELAEAARLLDCYSTNLAHCCVACGWHKGHTDDCPIDAFLAKHKAKS